MDHFQYHKSITFYNSQYRIIAAINHVSKVADVEVPDGIC